MFKKLSIIISLSYVSKILFALTTFILIRHFSVETYGLYSAALTFAAFFAVFLGFGINDFMVREGATNPQALPCLCGNNWLVSLAVSVVVFGAITVAGRWGMPDVQAYGLLLVLGVAVIVQSLQQIPWALLQVKQRIDLAGLGQILFAILSLTAAGAVVFFTMGIRELAWLQVVTAGAGLVFYGLLARPYARLTCDLGAIPATIKNTFPFGLSNLLAFVYIQSDIFLVARFRGDYEAGLYAAVFKLLLLFLVVPEMVYKTIVPRLFGTTATDPIAARQLYNDGLRFVLLVMAPLCLVCLVAAPEMLALLYGAKYASAAPLLLALGLLIVIQGLIHPAGQQLVANHRQHLRYKLQMVIAVVFVVANLLVIPRYGAMGAAMVSVVCRLLLLLLFTAALWRDGFAIRRATGDAQIGITLGMGIIAALAVRLTGVPAWGGMALLLAVYGGTLRLLRKKIGALLFLQKMAA